MPSGLLFILGSVTRVHLCDLGLGLLHGSISPSRFSAGLFFLELKLEIASQGWALVGVLLVKLALLEGSKATVVLLVFNVAYNVRPRKASLHWLCLLMLFGLVAHSRWLLL